MANEALAQRVTSSRKNCVVAVRDRVADRYPQRQIGLVEVGPDGELYVRALCVATDCASEFATCAEVYLALEKMPDGSSAIWAFRWADSGPGEPGHVVLLEKDDGAIYLFDPKTGERSLWAPPWVDPLTGERHVWPPPWVDRVDPLTGEQDETPPSWVGNERGDDVSLTAVGFIKPNGDPVESLHAGDRTRRRLGAADYIDQAEGHDMAKIAKKALAQRIPPKNCGVAVRDRAADRYPRRQVRPVDVGPNGEVYPSAVLTAVDSSYELVTWAEAYAALARMDDGSSAILVLRWLDTPPGQPDSHVVFLEKDGGVVYLWDPLTGQRSEWAPPWESEDGEQFVWPPPWVDRDGVVPPSWVGHEPSHGALACLGPTGEAVDALHNPASLQRRRGYRDTDRATRAADPSLADKLRAVLDSRDPRRAEQLAEDLSGVYFVYKDPSDGTELRYRVQMWNVEELARPGEVVLNGDIFNSGGEPIGSISRRFGYVGDGDDRELIAYHTGFDIDDAEPGAREFVQAWSLQEDGYYIYSGVDRVVAPVLEDVEGSSLGWNPERSREKVFDAIEQSVERLQHRSGKKARRVLDRFARKLRSDREAGELPEPSRLRALGGEGARNVGRQLLNEIPAENFVKYLPSAEADTAGAHEPSQPLDSRLASVDHEFGQVQGQGGQGLGEDGEGIDSPQPDDRPRPLEDYFLRRLHSPSDDDVENRHPGDDAHHVAEVLTEIFGPRIHVEPGAPPLTVFDKAATEVELRSRAEAEATLRCLGRGSSAIVVSGTSTSNIRVFLAVNIGNHVYFYDPRSGLPSDSPPPWGEHQGGRAFVGYLEADGEPARPLDEIDPRWVDVSERMDDAFAALSERERSRWVNQIEALNEDFASAMDRGVKPGSAEANKLADRDFQLRRRLVYNFDYMLHRHVGRRLVTDAGLRDPFERKAQGLARYVRDVIVENAKPRPVEDYFRTHGPSADAVENLQPGNDMYRIVEVLSGIHDLGIHIDPRAPYVSALHAARTSPQVATPDGVSETLRYLGRGSSAMVASPFLDDSGRLDFRGVLAVNIEDEVYYFDPRSGRLLPWPPHWDDAIGDPVVGYLEADGEPALPYDEHYRPWDGDGGTCAQIYKALRALSDAARSQLLEQMKAVDEDFVSAMDRVPRRVEPGSVEANELAERHFAIWQQLLPDYRYGSHLDLGRRLVTEAGLRAPYEWRAPGLARYVRDVIVENAERHLRGDLLAEEPAGRSVANTPDREVSPENDEDDSERDARSHPVEDYFKTHRLSGEAIENGRPDRDALRVARVAKLVSDIYGRKIEVASKSKSPGAMYYELFEAAGTNQDLASPAEVEKTLRYLRPGSSAIMLCLSKDDMGNLDLRLLLAVNIRDQIRYYDPASGKLSDQPPAWGEDPSLGKPSVGYLEPDGTPACHADEYNRDWLTVRKLMDDALARQPEAARLQDALERDFASAMARDVQAGSAEANDLAKRHFELARGLYPDYNYELHRHFGRRFVTDTGLRDGYERRAQGLARYMRDVIVANAGRHLGSGDARDAGAGEPADGPHGAIAAQRGEASADSGPDDDAHSVAAYFRTHRPSERAVENWRPDDDVHHIAKVLYEIHGLGMQIAPGPERLTMRLLKAAGTDPELASYAEVEETLDYLGRDSLAIVISRWGDGTFRVLLAVNIDDHVYFYDPRSGALHFKRPPWGEDAGVRSLVGYLDAHGKPWRPFGEFDVRRWHAARRQMANAVKALPEADGLRLAAEEDDLNRRFASAMDLGVEPGSAEANELAEQHLAIGRRLLANYDYGLHRYFGRRLVTDAGLRARYEWIAPGLARYVRDVIVANAERHLGGGDVVAEGPAGGSASGEGPTAGTDSAPTDSEDDTSQPDGGKASADSGPDDDAHPVAEYFQTHRPSEGAAESWRPGDDVHRIAKALNEIHDLGIHIDPGHEGLLHRKLFRGAGTGWTVMSHDKVDAPYREVGATLRYLKPGSSAVVFSQTLSGRNRVFLAVNIRDEVFFYDPRFEKLFPGEPPAWWGEDQVASTTVGYLRRDGKPVRRLDGYDVRWLQARQLMDNAFAALPEPVRLRLAGDSEALNRDFEAAMNRKPPLEPGSEEANRLADRHLAIEQELLPDYDYRLHRHFARRLVTDGELRDPYEWLAPGLASYVCDVIVANAERHLGPPDNPGGASPQDPRQPLGPPPGGSGPPTSENPQPPAAGGDSGGIDTEAHTGEPDDGDDGAGAATDGAGPTPAETSGPVKDGKLKRAPARPTAGDGPESQRLASLSPREREVLMLAAEGLTNPEIAAQLRIGLETVKTYVKQALAKLGARDRNEAVAMVFRDRGQHPGSPANAPEGLQERLASLSGREYEVMSLLYKGRSTREMAALLHISANTVRSHVKHVLTTLGAANRAEAMAMLAGLLSPSGTSAEALQKCLAGLTRRQREVLTLLATKGLTDQQIAAELHISESSVRTHIQRIVTKLGATNRVQAVAMLFRHGLLGPGSPADEPEVLRKRLASLIQPERKVLTLLAKAHTANVIAAALGVSDDAVDVYIERILAKLEARDRIQLVRIAYHCGLVHVVRQPLGAQDSPAGPPGTLDEVLEHLTRREVQVTRLLAEGLTNEQIAGRANLAPASVETFLDGAERKLHATTRAHLVKKAFDYGLVDPVEEAPTSTVQLTDREHEVLTRLADGHKVQDIAAQFNVPVAVVQRWIGGIMSTKVHAHDHAQLVARACQLHLLGEREPDAGSKITAAEPSVELRISPDEATPLEAEITVERSRSPPPGPAAEQDQSVASDSADVMPHKDIREPAPQRPAADDDYRSEQVPSRFIVVDHVPSPSEMRLFEPLDPKHERDHHGRWVYRREHSVDRYRRAMQRKTGHEETDAETVMTSRGCIGLVCREFGEFNYEFLTKALYFTDPSAQRLVGSTEGFFMFAEEKSAVVRGLLLAVREISGQLGEIAQQDGTEHERRILVEELAKAKRSLEVAREQARRFWSAIPKPVKREMIRIRRMARFDGGMNMFFTLITRTDEFNKILATVADRESVLQEIRLHEDLGRLDLNLVDQALPERPDLRGVVAVPFLKLFSSAQVLTYDDDGKVMIHPKGHRWSGIPVGQRELPDYSRFYADAATGQINMSNDAFAGKDGAINFDYGVILRPDAAWYDEESGTWLRANTSEYAFEYEVLHANNGAWPGLKPMVVRQSNVRKFLWQCPHWWDQVAGGIGFAEPYEVRYTKQVRLKRPGWLSPFNTVIDSSDEAAAPGGSADSAHLEEPQALLERLTAHEHAVLRLLCAGLTHLEITTHLGRTDRTVDNLVGRLLEKLGAETRAQLVTIALQNGLVEPDSEPQSATAAQLFDGLGGADDKARGLSRCDAILFDRELGDRLFHDPGANVAARRTVERLFEVMRVLHTELYPGTPPERTERIFFNDVSTNPGQVGRGVVTLPELLRVGNLRMVMTALCNAYSDSLDSMTFKKTILELLKRPGWEGIAESAGLDLPRLGAVKEMVDKGHEIYTLPALSSHSPDTEDALAEYHASHEGRWARLLAEREDYRWTMREFAGRGIALHPLEIAAQRSAQPRTSPCDDDPDVLAWVSGRAMFRMDPDAPWYQAVSTERGFPVIAGISSSAARLHSMFLWIRPEGVTEHEFARALVGWIVPDEHHTCYEVFQGIKVASPHLFDGPDDPFADMDHFVRWSQHAFSGEQLPAMYLPVQELLAGYVDRHGNPIVPSDDHARCIRVLTEMDELVAVLPEMDRSGLAEERRVLHADFASAMQRGVGAGSDDANALAVRHFTLSSRLSDDFDYRVQCYEAARVATTPSLRREYDSVAPGLARYVLEVIVGNAARPDVESGLPPAVGTAAPHDFGPTDSRSETHQAPSSFDNDSVPEEGPFPNRLYDSKADELADMRAAGVAPAEPGTPEFDTYINDGLEEVHFAVTLDDRLVVLPDKVFVPGKGLWNSAHGMLTEDVPAEADYVKTAGKARIWKTAEGYQGITIRNASGHYCPTPISLALYGLPKFAEYGIAFPKDRVWFQFGPPPDGWEH
ncbi:LuxR C-terminal-related transcriptional regulator [Mycobacterium sp. SP-6446]|uniref:LuxR C-terminal-related transcriptional regulator n=1 Tax=Mycobacterium sp. SP-6446 TaxID=1834162 RepID=UPI0011157C2E|nr:LuxR C-terminal-related transcriptional regulator [Mycobacterium sp. SP-6446]